MVIGWRRASAQQNIENRKVTYKIKAVSEENCKRKCKNRDKRILT